MKEDFVTPEIAKKLKEKGFDWDKITTYNPRTKVRNNHLEPTISQALKWLIKERGIFVEISPAYIDITYYVSVYKNKNGRYFKHYISELKYKSYEQAALAGIEYVLDNIIKEEQP